MIDPMRRRTLRKAAAAVGPPWLAIDMPGIERRSVSGWGSGGGEERLTLRFDLQDQARVEVETAKDPSSAGDAWWRFGHHALMKWGMVRQLGVPEQVQLETRLVHVPVDDIEREMFFLGDASHWVVGGQVHDRTVSAVGSSLDVAVLRLVTLTDLADYLFLDEVRSAPPPAHPA